MSLALSNHFKKVIDVLLCPAVVGHLMFPQDFFSRKKNKRTTAVFLVRIDDTGATAPRRVRVQCNSVTATTLLHATNAAVLCDASSNAAVLRRRSYVLCDARSTQHLWCRCASIKTLRFCSVRRARHTAPLVLLCIDQNASVLFCATRCTFGAAVSCIDQTFPVLCV